MVVNVANEYNVDRIFGEIDGALRANRGGDVGDFLLLCHSVDVFNKVLCDVHGINGASGRDFRRKHAGEKTGAGADVGDVHARLETDGSDDFVAEFVDLAALAFEHGDVFVDIGIFEVVVDAGLDALLLGGRGDRKDQ